MLECLECRNQYSPLHSYSSIPGILVYQVYYFIKLEKYNVNRFKIKLGLKKKLPSTTYCTVPSVDNTRGTHQAHHQDHRHTQDTSGTGLPSSRVSCSRCSFHISQVSRFLGFPSLWQNFKKLIKYQVYCKSYKITLPGVQHLCRTPEIC